MPPMEKVSQIWRACAIQTQKLETCTLRLYPVSAMSTASGIQTPDSATITAALNRWFGHASFRSGQVDAIQASLAGRDLVLVMPTGSGKSLCYQMTALLLPHTALIISPLIALMKDQVDALERRGIAATFLNSSLTPDEMASRLARFRAGRYKLLYIAPERFRNTRFLEAVRQTPISLLTVDEAHCISQWGHDFRPDYLHLKEVVKTLPGVRVMAVTATATPDVREDIVAQLGLGNAPRKEPVVRVHGFSRPNLHLAVCRAPTHAVKLQRVSACIAQHQSGIVYVATRRQAERVYERIRQSCGVPALLYHGALPDKEREQVQDAFCQAEHPVIVATNAFGMGVDRNDIRFICHWDVPGSVEAYYQEVGRAGRDGKPAWCELLFNYADVRTQQFFIDGANPTPSVILSLWEAVQRQCAQEPQSLTADAWAELIDEKNAMSVRTGMALLERAGLIQRIQQPGQRIATVTVAANANSAMLQDPLEKLRIKAERDNQRLQAIIRYAFAATCRHAYILSYFGADTPIETCGGCDHCDRHCAEHATAPTEVQWLIIQKLLSCVGRMQGRYGARRVIQVLRASSDPYLVERGLDNLSTFGLLRELPATTLTALIDTLTAANCLTMSNDQYRQVSLTAHGLRVVRRDEPDFKIVWPATPHPTPATRKAKPLGQSASVTKTSAPRTTDAALLEKLRLWRLSVAEQRRKPAYTVLHDRTLIALADTQPRTPEALQQITGIGPIKAARYGAEILDLIKASATDTADDASVTRP